MPTRTARRLRDPRPMQLRLPLPHDGHWIPEKDGNAQALELYKRHYSHRDYADGRQPKLFVGPGYKIVLMTDHFDALFVWRKFISLDHQQGINCAVFRNESSLQSSLLIREAMAIAWKRWPGERLYTYVNAQKIVSDNPGYCFKCAGCRTCGHTQGGLVILEAIA